MDTKTRKNETIEMMDYTEIVVPVSKAKPPQWTDNCFIQIENLSTIEKMVFKDIKSFNRIQSLVYQTALFSNENLLICAPTGAGKTNIALLTIIREITVNMIDGKINLNGFKVVYIAPMKALAAEVARKFSQALACLKIKVREYTGDMQLSKSEILKTQIIVTTPEKWDVVTRKPSGDMSLPLLARLLIIDEIHLLQDDRGPVIEAVVARTLRLVESSQSMIRLVGLSATLPNYLDVAEFLNVNKNSGLFFFDHRFRSVPLEQTFIGIKATRPAQLNQQLDHVCFERVSDCLIKNQQVLVFVHSRNATVKTADYIKHAANKVGRAYLFNFVPDSNKNNSTHSSYTSFLRKVANSKNEILKRLIECGLGTHHAGMLRRDRDLIEEAFLNGYIKVLICTATLSWGINLPVTTVIIRGTDVYDSSKGSVIPLSILDVQQIFGRAGRPQFINDGEYGRAILLTKHSDLSYYTENFVNPKPIESQLVKSLLVDAINAEIVLGSVTNLNEIQNWLKYTYLHIRMRKSPLTYGAHISINETDDNTTYFERELALASVRILDLVHMIRYDEKTERVFSTNIGRIASYYYIKYKTIQLFEDKLNPMMDDEDILRLISMSQEFEQILLRNDELVELEHLLKTCCRFGAVSNSIINKNVINNTYFNTDQIVSPVDKVFILIQTYISQAKVDSFSLISDTNYISQNAGRICRALFEIVMSKDWPFLGMILHRLSKSFMHRIWPSDNLLYQFSFLLRNPKHFINKIESKNVKIQHLKLMTRHEIGELINNHNVQADNLKMIVDSFPEFNITTTIKPITSNVLHICANFEADFVWNDVILGQSQHWLVLVVDNFNSLDRVHHYQQLTINKVQVVSRTPVVLDFYIPVFDPKPDQYIIKIISEKFLNCESSVIIYLDTIKFPHVTSKYTRLLELKPLSVYKVFDTGNFDRENLESLVANHKSCLKESDRILFDQLIDGDNLTLKPITVKGNIKLKADYHTLYKFNYFNPIQTQTFHTLFHTDENVLLGAPTGSGKTIVAELAMFRIFEKYPKRKVVYIGPLKALVRERMNDWSVRLEKLLGKRVVELTGDNYVSSNDIIDSNVIITTPEKWDGISRNWKTRPFVRDVGLIIFDEVHLLGNDRGPALEAIIARIPEIYSSDLSTNNLLTEYNKYRNVNSVEKCCGSTPVRIVALSTATCNADDLATWLNIPKSGLFNFRPSVRPVPVEIHIAGFSEDKYCPRMNQMNKTVFDSIISYSDSKPTLIFASSRRQTRRTALSLIAYLNHTDNSKRWLSAEYLEDSFDSKLDQIVTSVTDEALKLSLQFGIGIHHAGLVINDRKIVEELFLNQKIQVLIATSTLAWGVNFPAHLVIIKGTEYYDGRIQQYVDFPLTDVLQMIGRAGRPQFDASGVAVILVHESKKNFFKRFIYEAFPIESHLLSVLADHLNAEMAATTLNNVSDALRYLKRTYLYLRLVKNPSFYFKNKFTRSAKIEENLCADSVDRLPTKSVFSDNRIQCSSLDKKKVINNSGSGMNRCSTGSSIGKKKSLDMTEFLVSVILDCFDQLCRSRCIENLGMFMNCGIYENMYRSTFFGNVASYYYLSHKTVGNVVARLEVIRMKLGSKNLSTSEVLGSGGDESSVSSMFMSTILKLITDAEEFNEFPVRHNEDNYNRELYTKLAIKYDDVEVKSGVEIEDDDRNSGSDKNRMINFNCPHLKAFILLQCHFSRIELPITDYITDTKSLLDQCIRIIQATIDVASHFGLLEIVLQTIILMQCVVHGCWWNDSTLLSLPHVERSNLDFFKYDNFKSKKNSTRAKNNPLKKGAILQVAELYDLNESSRKSLSENLRSIYTQKVVDRIWTSFNSFPLIELSIKLLVNGCENGSPKFTTLSSSISNKCHNTSITNSSDNNSYKNKLNARSSGNSFIPTFSIACNNQLKSLSIKFFMTNISKNKKNKVENVCLVEESRNRLSRVVGINSSSDRLGKCEKNRVNQVGAEDKSDNFNKLIFAPRFPKPKEPCWFLIVADGHHQVGRLLAIKRISNFNKHCQVQVELNPDILPVLKNRNINIASVSTLSAVENTENDDYCRILFLDIYLMSDSIFGLDQQYRIKLITVLNTAS